MDFFIGCSKKKSKLELLYNNLVFLSETYLILYILKLFLVSTIIHNLKKMTIALFSEDKRRNGEQTRVKLVYSMYSI